MISHMLPVIGHALAALNFAHVPIMNHRASKTSWSKIGRSTNAYDFARGNEVDRVTDPPDAERDAIQRGK